MAPSALVDPLNVVHPPEQTGVAVPASTIGKGFTVIGNVIAF